jgi:flagella basal body P-ring formation protein FlgA
MVARLLLALSLLLPLLAAAAAVEASSLRQEALIEGDQVRLGDVFEGLSPEQARVAIARAPQLDRPVTLDARWAARVARAYGVDYSPVTGFEQITITRAGHRIPASLVEEEIAKLVRDQLPQGRVEMQFDAPADLHVPAEREPTISIETFRYESGSGRFTATLVAPAEGEPYLRRTLTGRAEAIVEVPVLAERLRAGDVIGAADIAWIDMPSHRVPEDVAIAEDELIGMSPRRALAGGSPVRLTDLRQPVVVGRGDRVTMAVRYGALRVTATGRALQDGAMSQTIRVVNIDSSRTVEAVVTGPNQVAVNPNGASSGMN